MKRLLIPFAALLLVAGTPPQDEAPARGAVWNASLVTDNVPDLTDVDRYLFSITSQYSDPQDQAIAIWRWSQRMRKQTTNPVEDGHFVLDPIRLFANYGHCNCGIISGVNNALWACMGWKGRYVQLGDHTVCEVSWDNGATWHMFDSSMSMYCFNDEGRVASTTEIEKNPRFYLQNYAPECGTPLCLAWKAKSSRCQIQRQVRRPAQYLRPSITRPFRRRQRER